MPKLVLKNRIPQHEKSNNQTKTEFHVKNRKRHKLIFLSTQSHLYQFSNNHVLFHLRLKENLLNHQNVSKYCEHDYGFGAVCP